MDIQKTMQNLEKNGIKPYFVENKDEVVPLVKTLINNGESVSCGGSVTLDETGVKALMQNGDYDFIDRTGLQGEKLRQSYIKTFGCDTFLLHLMQLRKTASFIMLTVIQTVLPALFTVHVRLL